MPGSQGPQRRPRTHQPLRRRSRGAGREPGLRLAQGRYGDVPDGGRSSGERGGENPFFAHQQHGRECRSARDLRRRRQVRRVLQDRAEDAIHHGRDSDHRWSRTRANQSHDRPQPAYHRAHGLSGLRRHHGDLPWRPSQGQRGRGLHRGRRQVRPGPGPDQGELQPLRRRCRRLAREDPRAVQGLARPALHKIG